jgi:hypothetical protein
MKAAIEGADRRTLGGRGATNILMAIVFKTAPEEDTRRFLVQNDWFIKDLPRNPYL